MRDSPTSWLAALERERRAFWESERAARDEAQVGSIDFLLDAPNWAHVRRLRDAAEIPAPPDDPTLLVIVSCPPAHAGAFTPGEFVYVDHAGVADHWVGAGWARRPTWAETAWAQGFDLDDLDADLRQLRTATALLCASPGSGESLSRGL